MNLLWFNLATDLDDPVLGFTTAWICAAARQVEQIHVITMRAGRVEVPDNVRVYSVGKEKGYSEARRAAEFYRHLHDIVRAGRVDACFSHMIPAFTVLAAPILRALGIPIVTWYCHPSLTLVLKLAHGLSHRVVSTIPSSYPYRHDKLVVLGHGIDTDLFVPEESLQPQDRPIVLCAGRLSPAKDHMTLIEAAHLIRQRCDTPFQVAIVGNPATPQDELYAQSLRERIEKLGLRETVELAGAATRAGLPDWYNRCAAHVNLTPPGFYDKVAIEAMSCARPSLVANEGFRPTLGEYSDRLLFRQGDATDLADKLQWILTQPVEESARIGAYLRKQVLELHSVERLTGRLREIMERPMTRSEGR